MSTRFLTSLTSCVAVLVAVLSAAPAERATVYASTAHEVSAEGSTAGTVSYSWAWD
ncbi:hypothetical protein ACIGQE_11245 [Streptomyces sp. NPDC053429]|uniref:hypothetical protein n=1 Tax=Streptomyces sp. NPDC053429 TaxID=3365702 RepID=UPI0037D7B945